MFSYTRRTLIAGFENASDKPEAHATKCRLVHPDGCPCCGPDTVFIPFTESSNIDAQTSTPLEKSPKDSHVTNHVTFVHASRGKDVRLKRARILADVRAPPCGHNVALLSHTPGSPIRFGCDDSPICLSSKSNLVAEVDVPCRPRREPLVSRVVRPCSGDKLTLGRYGNFSDRRSFSRSNQTPSERTVYNANSPRGSNANVSRDVSAKVSRDIYENATGGLPKRPTSVTREGECPCCGAPIPPKTTFDEPAIPDISESKDSTRNMQSLNPVAPSSTLPSAVSGTTQKMPEEDKLRNFAFDFVSNIVEDIRQGVAPSDADRPVGPELVPPATSQTEPARTRSEEVSFRARPGDRTNNASTHSGNGCDLSPSQSLPLGNGSVEADIPHYNTFVLSDSATDAQIIYVASPVDNPDSMKPPAAQHLPTSQHQVDVKATPTLPVVIFNDVETEAQIMYVPSPPSDNVRAAESVTFDQSTAKENHSPELFAGISNNNSGTDGDAGPSRTWTDVVSFSKTVRRTNIPSGSTLLAADSRDMTLTKAPSPLSFYSTNDHVASGARNDYRDIVESGVQCSLIGAHERTANICNNAAPSRQIRVRSITTNTAAPLLFADAAQFRTNEINRHLRPQIRRAMYDSDSSHGSEHPVVDDTGTETIGKIRIIGSTEVGTPLLYADPAPVRDRVIIQRFAEAPRPPLYDMDMSRKAYLPVTSYGRPPDRQIVHTNDKSTYVRVRQHDSTDSLLWKRNLQLDDTVPTDVYSCTPPARFDAKRGHRRHHRRIVDAAMPSARHGERLRKEDFDEDRENHSKHRSRHSGTRPRKPEPEVDYDDSQYIPLTKCQYAQPLYADPAGEDHERLRSAHSGSRRRKPKVQCRDEDDGQYVQRSGRSLSKRQHARPVRAEIDDDDDDSRRSAHSSARRRKPEIYDDDGQYVQKQVRPTAKRQYAQSPCAAPDPEDYESRRSTQSSRRLRKPQGQRRDEDDGQYTPRQVHSWNKRQYAQPLYAEPDNEDRGSRRSAYSSARRHKPQVQRRDDGYSQYTPRPVHSFIQRQYAQPLYAAPDDEDNEGEESTIPDPPPKKEGRFKRFFNKAKFWKKKPKVEEPESEEEPEPEESPEPAWCWWSEDATRRQPGKAWNHAVRDALDGDYDQPATFMGRRVSGYRGGREGSYHDEGNPGHRMSQRPSSKQSDMLTAVYLALLVTLIWLLFVFRGAIFDMVLFGMVGPRTGRRRDVYYDNAFDDYDRRYNY